MISSSEDGENRNTISKGDGHTVYFPIYSSKCHEGREPPKVRMYQNLLPSGRALDRSLQRKEVTARSATYPVSVRSPVMNIEPVFITTNGRIPPLQMTECETGGGWETVKSSFVLQMHIYAVRPGYDICRHGVRCSGQPAPLRLAG